MRLASLTLESYGPFRHLALAFDPTPGRLNLLVAPNGYGKSVIRGALHDLLFGIHPQSPMAYLHGTQQMRLRAEVVSDEGRLSLVRRKGMGNTLADAEGREIPDATFRRLTGGADKLLFKELFGLDTELLRQGGLALLKSDGRLGQMLFAGSGALGRVRNVLEDLTARRDELGGLRRQQGKPLWAAVKLIQDAQQEIHSSAIRPESWQQMERDVVATDTAFGELRRERAGIAARLDALRLVQKLRPWLAARRTASEVLAAAGEVPRLDADFEKRWRDALADHSSKVSTAVAAAQQLEAQKMGFAGIVFDGEMVNAADQVTELNNLRAVALQAEADLPEIMRRMAETGANVDRLRSLLGWNAVQPVPPTQAIRTARELLNRRAGVLAKAADAAREFAEAKRRLARDEAAKEALPTPLDVTGIAALAAAMRAQGDPGRRLEAAALLARTTAAGLDAALAVIPGTRLSVAALRETAAPSVAVRTRIEEALAAAESSEQASATEAARIAREQAATAEELASLQQATSLPAPSALADARDRRDRIWASLQRLATGDAPSPEEAGGLPTWMAFDRALQAADAVADALLAHGAAVTKADGLRTRLKHLDENARAAATAGVAASARSAAIRGDLSACAAKAGASDIQTSAALREYLAARQGAVDQCAAADRAQAEYAGLSTSLAAQAAELAAALTRPRADLASLPALLAHADVAIEAGRQGVMDQKKADADLEKSIAEEQARATSASAAEQQALAWADDWSAAIKGLARPAEEPVAVSAAALDLIEELREAESVRDALTPRGRDMQAAIAIFAEAATTLVGRLAPDLHARPPAEAANLLARRVQVEREAAAKAEALQSALTRAERLKAGTQAAADAAIRHLAAMRTALRANDDEAAERQLALAHQVAGAEARLQEAEAQLRDLGEGQPLAELEAMAAASDREAEPAEIAELSDRQGEINRLAEKLAVEQANASEQLKRSELETNTGAAAARRETGIAALSRAAEQMLVLHAAAALLRASLERQRAASESGMVGQIGAAFRAITCGGHAGVTIEDAGQGQRLVALEADGTGRKQIDQLSEGTRDQLYLALRMVALETFAAGGPALPFLADDVLQTFDDDRTLSSLQALAGLSHHVQVIAMTHHPHVQALAQSLPAGMVHFVELADLPDRVVP